MIKLSLILLLLIAVGCSEEVGTLEKLEKEELNKSLNLRYGIVKERIDGCEYIIANSWDGISIIHKANCDNHK